MTAPVLEPVGEGEVALQAVNVDVEIENLLSEVTIKQIYSNLEKINIEAVYTFPLPLDAVLMDMTIKTKKKELKGVVIEKKEAEDRYEEAITDGDTAIMLEQVDSGLYTMNVGNLQPEDTVEISITYAQLFKWRDNSLRFFLPTTIAPRYGDPGSLGVQPHQAPEYDLTVENPFTITVSISGVLSEATIESPSHKIITEKQDQKTAVSLEKGEALMDRDFVLNIFMETENKSVAPLEPDGDDYIALASFYPRFPSVTDKLPRCITIIVDCSGSMGGDSIAQARKALYEIIELLRSEDRFNIVRFGSSFKKLFPAPVPADGDNIKKAKNLLEVLEADMGGTEIGQAIDAAIKGRISGKISNEVLLITDGEVWNWEKVTKKAAKSGFRFFTVGVGSSVSEAFVQILADTTGGACELVSPNEDMAEKIVRHFKRIYFPRAENVEISWPGEPKKTFPEHIGFIYDGDTLHVFGMFKERIEGDVELRAELENGQTIAQKLPIQNRSHTQASTELPGATARMAAACEIRAMENPEEIAAMGVKYQLMSPFTNYLAIDVKADSEKAEDLPDLRKTPQMLAAGWGGSGSVEHLACDNLGEVKYSMRRMGPSYDNIQQLPIVEMKEDNHFERTIEKRLSKTQEFLEQSKMEQMEFLEHRSRQLHYKLTELQEKLFAVQADNIDKLFDKVELRRIETLVEKIHKYLKVSIDDHLRSVSEIFREELHQYDGIVNRFGQDVINRLENLIKEVSPFVGLVDLNNWVEFGNALERYYKSSGVRSPKLLSVQKIKALGFPDEMASFLEGLIKEKDTEAEIVCAFLFVLLSHPVERLLSRETKRIIRKQYKDMTPSEKLYTKISDYMILKNR